MFHSSAKADDAKKKYDRDRVIRIVKMSPELFVNEAVPNLFNTKYKPNKRGIEQYKKIAFRVSKQGIIAALEGMKDRVDREIVLKFAPYPVLFIIGEKDKILPYKELITQASLSEKGSFLLLKNSGHMGFVEAKEETFKAIKSFVLEN